MNAEDFKVEVGFESDVVEDINLTCDKNPGHEGFIPFEDLSLEHLPPDWRMDRILNFIRYRGRIVVRLIVTRVDGEKMYGTGYVSKFEGQYVITTNNHVISNDQEAKRCLIEFNYDNDDRSNIILCEGTGMLETSELLDSTLISFLPIPRMVQELDLIDDSLFMPKVEGMNENGDQETTYALAMPYMVNESALLAMPHHFNLNRLKEITIPFFDGTRSKLASPYLMFQPVLDSLQDSAPDVAIADENGQTSTVVKGTIEDINGAVYIYLPTPITDEEAKRCTVIFSDGRISRGVGVYFKHVTLFNANIKGLDMDFTHMLSTGGMEALRLATTPFWMVPFKPVPGDVMKHLNMQEELSGQSNVKTVVIIGHPHGWRKMVTFGRDLGINLDLTDGEYRCSVSYTGKTCPGSSGSPVLYLRSFRSYVHHGGRRVEEYGAQAVETNNVNMAWWWKQYLTTLFLKP